MENPTDRVTYGDLRMIREEFDDLMQLSIQAGTIKHPIPYETYIDERFVRAQKTASHSAVIRRLALLLLLGTPVAAAAPRRDAGRAQGRRAQPGDGRARAQAAGHRRQAAQPRALSRQGGAARVRLQQLRRSLPDHARHARRRAQEAGRRCGANVQVVYVTVDPERDDAAQMKKFLGSFDPTFVGGVGTRARDRCRAEELRHLVDEERERRRQLHHRPLVLHLHDRSRRRPAGRHALRPHRRRLRA